MSTGNVFSPYEAWAKLWQSSMQMPLSGDVVQDINPITRWLSPQLEFNFAGNQALEAKVVSEVASYGKQLGVLAEAVLALADEQSGPELERLKAMVVEIETIKQQHQKQELVELQQRLKPLQHQDPAQLKELLTEFQ